MAQYIALDNNVDDLLIMTYGQDREQHEKDFDLTRYTDEQCRSLFRFENNHITLLKNELDIPDMLKGNNGCVFSGEEGLCILLRRLSYPNRLEDLTNLFGRPKAEMSLVFNRMLDFVHNRHSHLLSSLNQSWLARPYLEEFSNSVARKGAPLNNCWGFIDGTVRPICRPSQNQRLVYNGHKRVHSLKFQCVSTPNGLIANLYGPIEGKRHDAGMLRESRLMDELDQNMTMPDGTVFSLYGDPAYPMRTHLLAPFRGNRLAADEAEFNRLMSSVRVTVEWTFGKILANFAFVDYKKNQKLYLQPVGKYYNVAAVLTNCHTCLYGSEVSDFFDLQPPNLHEYLHGF